LSGLATEDYEMLRKTPKETLLSLFYMHIRNIWRVDGLYFLGIEEKFGTEAAAQIDTDCWKVLGKLEARELKNLLGIRKNDIPAFMHALRNTSWSLYQEEKETEITPSKGIYRVTKCRIQETRTSKALDVFPCKNVRFSYLKSFAEEFNPDIEAKCQVAPPEKRPAGVWCQWEFTLKRKK
jgi:hypothetical protein